MIKSPKKKLVLIASILPRHTGEFRMNNKIKKYTLLIISGISPLFPFLFLLPSIADKNTRGSYTTEIIIAICFAFISTSLVHTKELFIPWDEFIKDRYMIKTFDSDPWVYRTGEYSDNHNSCFTHYVVAVIYFFVIVVNFREQDYASMILGIICTAYYATIAVMFMLRSWKMSDGMQDNWLEEQRWNKAKKKVSKLLKKMLEGTTWSYYSAKNLHEEMPIDIRSKLSWDLDDNVKEFADLPYEQRELILEDAWTKALHIGFAYKEKTKSPQS